jgi:proteasome lid subunit RPN8/RPN11
MMGPRACLTAHAERCYPEECVGALVGDALAVREAWPLENIAVDRRHGFEVSARALLEVEARADEQGLRVWGYYHSHPDAPAVPSTADAALASPGRLMVIVGVAFARVGAVRGFQPGANGLCEVRLALDGGGSPGCSDGAL